MWVMRRVEEFRIEDQNLDMLSNFLCFGVFVSLFVFVFEVLGKKYFFEIGQ